jgi:Phosphotransferase System HPr (HPr) Family
MVKKKLKIINEAGLHLRPAGVLSQISMKFKSNIIIKLGEREIAAKSLLNIMAAGLRSADEIELICDGEDEAEAMEVISNAIENGLSGVVS